MPRPSSVPFEWMEPHRAPGRAKLDAQRRTGMYRAELEERAALLARLGHGREAVRGRLVSNLGWDFPPSRRPLSDGDVDEILDRVFPKPVSTARASKGAPK